MKKSIPTKTSRCKWIKLFHETDCFRFGAEKYQGDGGRCPPSDPIDDGLDLLTHLRSDLDDAMRVIHFSGQLPVCAFQNERSRTDRSLGRRDLVHQEFTSGALIEKRANGRVIGVREGGRSSSPGKPPSSGVPRADTTKASPRGKIRQSPDRHPSNCGCRVTSVSARGGAFLSGRTLRTEVPPLPSTASLRLWMSARRLSLRGSSNCRFQRVGTSRVAAHLSGGQSG